MKKILTIAALSILSFGALTPASAQEGWLYEGTQLIVPQDSDIDEDEVITFYVLNRHYDYQGPEMPHYLITDRKARAVFTIGGFVNFRTAFDFMDVMPDLDFIPALIPTQSSVSNTARVLMDGSTSRLFTEAVIKTRSGNPLKAYVEVDFRGEGNTLRLRQAYVSYYGFKFGQATSTFTDINSAYNTIDFEGPNAFTYRRNLMIQYTKAWQSGISMGVALEYPVVEATYGSDNEAMYQRFPDLPLYVQYAWSSGYRASHIRLSALMRTMTYTDEVAMANKERIGWGVQASGSFELGRAMRLYGQFTYGEGISQYVQDLQGLPYDMISNLSDAGTMITLPTTAWFVGAEFHLTNKMPLTIGYSQVKLDNKENYLSGSDYHLGQYIVANCFYNFGTAINVGIEYLYGSLDTFDGGWGKSNRLQAAVQFNF
ncbi:MAG: DcaP family trimeric outer membrane transporter [Rikenellaceae bacterium]